jgi:prepilin-type N-terminal cleavage/methylation domain-containing protein
MLRRSEDGFSLVEVILALALLGAVLISISGLFVIGGRSVQSGRTSSEALAAARTVLEDINHWGFRQTYMIFGIDHTATTAAPVRTDVATGDAHLDEMLQRWQGLIGGKLFDGYATVELEPLGYDSTIPQFQNARAIRITVTVFWNEGIRPRQAEIRSVKM